MILALLENRPRHGYEIAQLIELRSRGAIRFNVASLYPLLYRLEKRSWIRGRWVEKPGQRRRRYYGLTASGKNVLSKQRAGWREFVEAINLITGIQHADFKGEIRERPAKSSLISRARAEIVEELAACGDEYERTSAAARGSEARKEVRSPTHPIFRLRSRHVGRPRIKTPHIGNRREDPYTRRPLARFALRSAHTPKKPRVHDHRCHRSRSRHRREQRDLQRRKRCPAAAAPIQKPRTTGDGVGKCHASWFSEKYSVAS